MRTSYKIIMKPTCPKATHLVMIFIVPAHCNNNPRTDISLHSRQIILIPSSQPVFALTPKCCVLSK